MKAALPEQSVPNEPARQDPPPKKVNESPVSEIRTFIFLSLSLVHLRLRPQFLSPHPISG